MTKLLVTGSNGLIGSEVVRYFGRNGWMVHGVDNNMREDFFGAKGNTRWNQQRLLNEVDNFTHHELDIRDRKGVQDLVDADIFEAEAAPIHEPSILVDDDAEQLTFEVSSDIYPKHMPSEENASREGADPTAAGYLGQQTDFCQPDLSVTTQDFTGVEAEYRQELSINVCLVE